MLDTPRKEILVALAGPLVNIAIAIALFAWLAFTERPVRLESSDVGVVVDRMRNGKGNFGFDASKGTYVDLVEAGIIDPTKVVRVALENAVSVASVLLLTEATMTDIPEPPAKAEASPHLD